jgi:hypothetical protein
LDEDFCSILVPKVLELLCRAGGALEGGALKEILSFLSITTKVSRECKKRMSGWLLQFIPSVLAEHRPALLLALPSILPSIEGVLEEALLKSVREGRRDLAEASFTCLLRFKSQKMADLFEEAFADSSTATAMMMKFSLPALIEASRAFPQISPLKSRIRAILADQLENGELDWDSASAIEFAPGAAATEPVDLLLWLIACSQCRLGKSDIVTCNAHRQFHRACLAAPLLTLSLLQKLPSKCDFSGLLELFSVFLEVIDKEPSTTMQSADSDCCEQLLLLSAFAERFLNTGKEKAFLNVLTKSILAPGSGMIALKLLQRVIQISPASRWSCLGVVKALLEGLESMDLAKVSLFYTVFAALARDSDTVSNELLLLLKKQLYSFDPIYKRIGARGVVIFCSKLGAINSKLLPDPDEIEDESAAAAEEGDDADECIAGCSQMPQTVKAKIPLPTYATRLKRQ